MSAAGVNSLYDDLFAVKDAAQLFNNRACVAAMLQVEAALAKVQAQLGIIPRDAAALIIDCCNVERFDLSRLAAELLANGNLAIPLVQQLTALVRAQSPQAAGFVHWGATSQDILDTGLILQLRPFMVMTDHALERLMALLAALTRQHARTLMPGRTWMQHAVPITFGLKTAGWLSSLMRDRERLTQMKSRSMTLQFGGAAGTLASLDRRGLQVAAALADELELTLPDVPWHGARDRVAEVATVYSILSGTMSKIARDLSLLTQTEVAELAEGAAPGRGGSSTMPHKRNPVGVAAVLACTQRVPGLVATILSTMPQEHERGLGGWGAEWETLPQLCTLVFSALTHLERVFNSLEVFPEAMRHNLDLTHGLMLSEAVSMRLAAHIGRDRAHKLLQQSAAKTVASGLSLKETVMADPEITKHLSATDIEDLFDPANYLGATADMIDCVLQRYARSQSEERAT